MIWKCIFPMDEEITSSLKHATSKRKNTHQFIRMVLFGYVIPIQFNSINLIKIWYQVIISFKDIDYNIYCFIGIAYSHHSRLLLFVFSFFHLIPVVNDLKLYFSEVQLCIWFFFFYLQTLFLNYWMFDAFFFLYYKSSMTVKLTDYKHYRLFFLPIYFLKNKKNIYFLWNFCNFCW